MGLERAGVVILTVASIACGGGGGGGGGSPTTPVVQRASVTSGCYSVSYQGYANSAIGCGPVQTFGDAGFDQRFVEEVQIQLTFWNIPGSVWAFDECPGVVNALSIPAPYWTILFGKNLVFSVLILIGSELPIAGVMAHEFGHQVQFRKGWMNPSQSTVRLSELEADAFSGYYMAIAKGWAGEQLESYLQGLFLFGDYHFNSPQHHGTPEERYAAGVLGLLAGFDAIDRGKHYTYQQLHNIFTGVISGNFSVSQSNTMLAGTSVQEIADGIDLAGVEAVRAGMKSVSEFEHPGPFGTPRFDLAPQ